MESNKIIDISAYRKNKISLPSIRFVVVDDNELLLRIWNRIFSTEKNCDFFLTASPLEGLSEIKNKKVDILIADFVMPKMDGIELLQKAKKISPDLHAFLTTGYISNFKRIQPWQEKSEILQKPYSDIEKVKLFVHNLIRRRPPLDQTYCKKEGKIFVWSL